MPARWVSGVPLGGNVAAIAVDPANAATLYAGADSGVAKAKSTDGGFSWS